MTWIDRLNQDLKLAKAAMRGVPAMLRARPGGAYTVADAIEEVVADAPGRIALVFEDREVTYADLDRRANRVARWALEVGLSRGDVVALLMENRPEFVIYWLGLAKIGVVTALINTNLTGRPLAHSLSISGARHLILDVSLEENWSSIETEQAGAFEVWASGGKLGGTQDLDASIALQPKNPLPRSLREGLVNTDQLFFIYTSGTTGLPKAARFSHLRFLGTAIGAQAVARLEARDRMYIVLPLYHSAGGVMALGGALLSGATVVLARRFSASGFWEDCVRHDVTVFQYIGELCRYLVNSPRHADEHRHRIRLCIGNGLRPEIWDAFQKRFGISEIIEFYGATEGNVSFMNVDNRIGSVGRMPRAMQWLAGVHLVEFDVEREEVVRGPDGFCIEAAVGEPGEALGRISGATRFEGYSDPKASEQKILRNVFRRGDAYFRTGDLLRRDEDDFFYFVDRVGDTFRWKGENVSTGEVAEVVASVEGVEEANVYGVEVPSGEGRAGMASIVVNEDFALDRLFHELEAHLPSYARPVFLRILPEIEVTGTFKHRKVSAMKEGFDPAVIDDPLYLLDAKQGAFVPLDPVLFEAIESGTFRL